jgi:Derlin-2/3
MDKRMIRTRSMLGVIGLRGGAVDGDGGEELDDEGDEGVDEGAGLGDGQQNQMLASVGDMWIKTPPMTQIYVGSSLFATLAAFLLNKNAWPEFLNLDWGAVLTKFQFWRPFTSFLFFGPLGLNYLLTIHFVWTYMAQLEKLNYKKPEEFFVMMVFGALSLLTGYTLTGLSPKFLGHNLSTFLVYIWARIFEGTDVNVMDLFFLKAELLPWFFSAQTLILEGEVPFADLLGIVVGHLYHYLTKNNILKVPDAVKGLFASPSLKARYESFKGDFE